MQGHGNGRRSWANEPASSSEGYIVGWRFEDGCIAIATKLFPIRTLTLNPRSGNFTPEVLQNSASYHLLSAPRSSPMFCAYLKHFFVRELLFSPLDTNALKFISAISSQKHLLELGAFHLALQRLTSHFLRRPGSPRKLNSRLSFSFTSRRFYHHTSYQIDTLKLQKLASVLLSLS